jgi:hypothetical protein
LTIMELPRFGGAFSMGEPDDGRIDMRGLNAAPGDQRFGRGVITGPWSRRQRGFPQ